MFLCFYELHGSHLSDAVTALSDAPRHPIGTCCASRAKPVIYGRLFDWIDASNDETDVTFGTYPIHFSDETGGKLAIMVGVRASD
jgi:hypothetical protein